MCLCIKTSLFFVLCVCVEEYAVPWSAERGCSDTAMEADHILLGAWLQIH